MSSLVSYKRFCACFADDKGLNGSKALMNSTIPAKDNAHTALETANMQRAITNIATLTLALNPFCLIIINTKEHLRLILDLHKGIRREKNKNYENTYSKVDRSISVCST